MKALLRIAIPALLCGAALAGTSADADAQTVAKRVTRVARKVGGFTWVSLTVVKGNVTGPADISWKLEGFKCSDMSVLATSKDHTTAPPNQPPGSFFIPEPKWVRLGTAGGTWPNCTYSVPVPPGKQFSLSAVAPPNADYPCTSISLQSTGTGGYMSVPKGTTKTQNFKVTDVSCDILA